LWQIFPPPPSSPHPFGGSGGEGPKFEKSQNTQIWGELDLKCVFGGFVTYHPSLLPLPPLGGGAERLKIAKHANME